MEDANRADFIGAAGIGAAEFLRDVDPGEIVRIDEDGLTTVARLMPPPGTDRKKAMCIFELIYFSRPDSRVFGQTVDKARRNLGRRLAQELLGVRPALAFDHLIHKPAGNRSATPWHQDAAFAPTVQVAVHLWVPFDEVGPDDSCMQFVPGSHHHRWVHRPRGGNPEAHALDAVDVDTRTAVRCPVPLGGLTAHQPGTLHHTGPNEGRRDRTAWIMQFRPDGLWRVRAVLDRRHR